MIAITASISKQPNIDLPGLIWFNSYVSIGPYRKEPKWLERNINPKKSLHIYAPSRSSKRKEYSDFDVKQLKRLKELEQENSRLKRVVADQVLDISILKEFNKGNY